MARLTATERNYAKEVVGKIIDEKICTYCKKLTDSQKYFQVSSGKYSGVGHKKTYPAALKVLFAAQKYEVYFADNAIRIRIPELDKLQEKLNQMKLTYLATLKAKAEEVIEQIMLGDALDDIRSLLTSLRTM